VENLTFPLYRPSFLFYLVCTPCTPMFDMRKRQRKNGDFMKICAIKIKYQENKRTEKRMVCYNRKNKRKWRKQ